MYCSNPTSPGGGYRSAFGRLFFKTNEMIQVVEAPDIVRNRVSFSLFGFLDGEVSLKGMKTDANMSYFHVHLFLHILLDLSYCLYGKLDLLHQMPNITRGTLPLACHCLQLAHSTRTIYTHLTVFRFVLSIHIYTF